MLKLCVYACFFYFIFLLEIKFSMFWEIFQKEIFCDHERKRERKSTRQDWVILFLLTTFVGLLGPENLEIRNIMLSLIKFISYDSEFILSDILVFSKWILLKFLGEKSNWLVLLVFFYFKYILI